MLKYTKHNFVSQNIQNNYFWQSSERAKMLLNSNQAGEIFFFEDGFLVEKRSVSMGEFGLFAIGVDKKVAEKSLIELCKQENCLFVQVENFSYDENFIEFEILQHGFYKKFITPYTAIISLEKTEEEILSAMKQKGRYNIKLAEKKGISVKNVAKTCENVKNFFELMNETTQRDGFNGNTLEYYENFLKNENSKLFFAEKDGKILSAGIFLKYGKTGIYYYGASTSDEKYRNMMAPYLLQWEAIKYFKNEGCEIYDFLGVASPDEKNSKLAGVTDFKLKLTPEIKFVSQSFIFQNKKFKYFLIKNLRKLKNLRK